MEIAEERLIELWATGKTIKIDSTDYIVHKMSYGAYFLEPADYKGGELDQFHHKTIWPDRAIRQTVNGYRKVYYIIN